MEVLNEVEDDFLMKAPAKSCLYSLLHRVSSAIEFCKVEVPYLIEIVFYQPALSLIFNAHLFDDFIMLHR